MQDMHSDAGVITPVFRHLEVDVVSSYPSREDCEKNIIKNMEADWPRLQLREDYGIARNKPLAMCCGGPSLRDFLGKIHDDFSDIMVCGSAHDFVIISWIDPTYSIQMDGGIEAKAFFKLRLPKIQYLMASQCDPSMFDGLPRDQVSMWHALMGADLNLPFFKGETAFGGGCTTPLRAISVAVMMGYHDLHMFGFDSCFTDVNNQHAYAYKEWSDSTTQEFLVRVDDGKPFKCNALFLAQAQQFQQMCKNFGHLFEPHVYGDGLIAEMIKVGRAKLMREQIK